MKQKHFHYPQVPTSSTINGGADSVDYSSTSFPIIEMNPFSVPSPILPLKPTQSQCPILTPSTMDHGIKRMLLMDIFNSR